MVVTVWVLQCRSLVSIGFIAISPTPFALHHGYSIAVELSSWDATDQLSDTIVTVLLLINVYRS